MQHASLIAWTKGEGGCAESRSHWIPVQYNWCQVRDPTSLLTVAMGYQWVLAACVTVSRVARLLPIVLKLSLKDNGMTQISPCQVVIRTWLYLHIAVSNFSPGVSLR